MTHAWCPLIRSSRRCKQKLRASWPKVEHVQSPCRSRRDTHASTYRRAPARAKLLCSTWGQQRCDGSYACAAQRVAGSSVAYLGQLPCETREPSCILRRRELLSSICKGEHHATCPTGLYCGASHHAIYWQR